MTVAKNQLGRDGFTVTAAPEVLSGGPGDDEIYGFNGDDTINGGDGDDKLYSGIGTDTLDHP